jgi:hypothetical protein
MNLSENVAAFNTIPRPDASLVGPEAWRIYRHVEIELKPHVHLLFSAAWRSGFTVNGVRP